jgi:hypothetical protein
MLGVEVLDQHEGHAGGGGECSQQLAEGLEAASGRADADDRERRRRQWLRVTIATRGIGRDGLGHTAGRAPRCRLSLVGLSSHQPVITRFARTHAMR